MNRPQTQVEPVNRNLVVWALNLGISRIIRQYKRYEDSVRDTSQPLSVFEQMQQQDSSDYGDQ